MVVHVTFTQSFVRLMPVMSGRGTTAMTKDFESDNAGDPLSVTVMEKLFVVSTSASLVSHENNPDDGSMLAPEAAPGARLKVSVFAGVSESVAEVEMLIRLPA